MTVPPTPPLSPSSEFSAPEPAYLEPVAAAEARPTPNLTDLALLVGILLGALIVAIVGGGIGMAVWAALRHVDMRHMDTSQKMVFAVPFQVLWYALTAGVAVPIFRRRWRRPFALGVQWNSSAAGAHALVLLGAGALLSIAVMLVSLRIHVPPDAKIYELFRYPALAWTATVFGVLVAPAMEELAFRGFLLTSLARHTGKIAAVLITSALFALLHAGQIGHAWMAVVLLGVVSVVLCAVRLRYNSVAASTLVHMAYNGVLFAMMIAATGGYRHLDKIPH